jgi:hypothetical protein
MKKTIIKLAAIMLAVVMMSCMFASCAKKLSGSYEADASLFGQGVGVTYTFSGSKFTATTKVTLLGQVSSEEVSGVYEIIEYDDGSMEIKLDFEDETATLRDGTYTFDQGEDYIKIAGIKYKKLDK